MTEQEKWDAQIQARVEQFMQAYIDLIADTEAYEAKGFTSSAPVTDAIWSAKAVDNFIHNTTADSGDHIGNLNKARWIA